MLVKRIGVLAVSLVIGYIFTFGIVTLIGTTVEEYGGLYTFFTALSIGLAIAVWLDKFLGTEMLPE